MTDETLIQAGDERLIGVGMGGSCPSCRAPIDLGQEFCLECGAPIRFSARQQQRKGGRNSGGTTGPGGTPPGAPRRFPWVPFGIVLALIVGGIAFAVVGTGDSASTKEPKTKTETALPSITNESPEDTTTDTAGAAGVDCPTGLPSDSTGVVPGTGTTDPNALGASSGAGEQIPEVSGASPGMLGSNDPSSDAFPSATDSSGDALADPSSGDSSGDAGAGVNPDCPTTPGSTGTDPATGALDSLAPTSSTPSVPASTPPSSTTTTPAASPTSPTNSGATSWPDKDGWTVVVFGYSDQNRANQRAADLQEDGFESGVLFSTDYGSLCPGFYVVFSGVYTTEAQATNQMKRLQGKYQGMYVKKIAKDGTAKGCKT